MQVSDPLQDPTLEIHDQDGATIAFDDNWKDTQEAEIEATGLAPTDDRESAIVLTLGDGLYTAIVRGVNDTVGVALVEIYNINWLAGDEKSCRSPRPSPGADSIFPVIARGR